MHPLVITWVHPSSLFRWYASLGVVRFLDEASHLVVDSRSLRWFLHCGFGWFVLTTRLDSILSFGGVDNALVISACRGFVGPLLLYVDVARLAWLLNYMQ